MPNGHIGRPAGDDLADRPATGSHLRRLEYDDLEFVERIGSLRSPAILVPPDSHDDFRSSDDSDDSAVIRVTGDLFVSAQEYAEKSLSTSSRSTAGIGKVLADVSSFDGFYAVDLTADPSIEPADPSIEPAADMRHADPYADGYHNQPAGGPGPAAPNAPPGNNPLLGWLRANGAQAGDILFGSHPINYMTAGRTQHCALVQDVDGELILESDCAHVGTDKPGLRCYDWVRWAERYLNVYLTRVKDISPDQALQVVRWAQERIGTPYRWPLFDGTDKNNDKRMYCAQMVWVGFKRVLDIDLDRDGGSMVFPDDMFYNENHLRRLARVRGQ